VRLPAQVAKERYELLVARLEKRKAQLALEAQISAKVPILKGGTLVIPVGLLLAQQGQADPTGVDAAARKRVELLAMNAVFEAEKGMDRMPKDVSAQRGWDATTGGQLVNLPTGHRCRPSKPEQSPVIRFGVTYGSWFCCLWSTG
jgi:hypothetical protein